MDYIFISDKEILEDIGAKFKEARIDMRITQEELVKQSGISRTTISRLESGENISLLNFISMLREVGDINDLAQVLKSDNLPDPKEQFLKEQKSRKRQRA